MTIWTAVTMTDIVYEEEAGKGIAYSALNDTQTTGNETGTRLISTANTGWMLGAGWLFYLASFLLNLLYYMLHPSGPEFCSWGKEEELEEWTPTGQRETEKRQANNRNQPEASNIELTELLPTGSNGDFQTDDIDYIDDTD